jgi:hypothetical protein
VRDNWRAEFIARITPKKKPSRTDILEALEDFGVYGDDPVLMWQSFIEYEENGILPFSGGFLEMPSWWHRNLITFRWLKLWMNEPDTSADLPNALDL